MYSNECASEQISQLEASYGHSGIARGCGHFLNAESVGPKLMWMQQQRPEIWARTREVHTSHSLVVRRLCGVYALDHTTASLWDPLYNPWTNSWNHDLAAEMNVDKILPTLAWPEEIVGRVTPVAAAQTGIPAGVPVVAGSIDFAAEQVGAGAEDVGQAIITYGSTMVVQTVCDEVVVGRESYSCVGVTPATHLIGGVTATAGTLVAWWRELLGDVPITEMSSVVAGSPVGSRGLLMLPYFAGERSPVFDINARGALIGLTLQHRPRDLLRSAMEGTAFALRHILDSHEQQGIHVTSAIATGGGAVGLWPQIVSDCTRIDQTVPLTKATGAMGAALWAARAAGSVQRNARWRHDVTQIRPNLQAADVYDAMYKLYRDLYPATKSIAHELAKLATTTAV